MLESQFILNGVAASSVYIIAGLSFQIIYSTNGFFHFAHAALFAVGAYALYFAITFMKLTSPMAIIFVILSCGALGIFLDYCFYRHLKKENATELIMLLGSLGIYVVLQNLLSMIFADEVRMIRVGEVKTGIEIFGGYLSEIQGWTILAASVTAISMAFFLKYTHLGLAVRASESNSSLSRISGIDSDRVSLWCFAVGSALGGFTGVLVAMDVGMTPSMGMRLLMMGVVTVIVGGTRSIAGVVLGAFLLGMTQHVGARFISTQWQDATAFIILLGVLLLRPEGFLGKRNWKSTV